MAELITMPKLSDTMEEGGIAEWFKQEGDQVAEGDLLLGIETDKATVEYASPEEGVLLKILAQPGDSCALGQAIAVIGEAGEELDPALWEQATPAAEAAAPEAAAPPPAAASKAAEIARIKASPLARKQAQALGVDLSELAGSGPGGRVIVRDLEGWKSQQHTVVPKASAEDVRIPLTMMRKTIAKRLLAGKNEAPHFYLQVGVDVGQLLAWRQRINSGDVRVSVNDLLLFFVAKALRRHPEINASWQGDHILQYGRVDLGVAVALPSGLITPVIRNADSLGLYALAAQSKALIGRAKEGTLTAEEYQGGTFTVSNLGMTRVNSFTAIINPPQAAILAVGRVQDLMQPVDDGKSWRVRKQMDLTLSCDHRVIDGLLGARFLETLAGLLEDPLQALL